MVASLSLAWMRTKQLVVALTISAMLAGCASRSPNPTAQAPSHAAPPPFHRTITIVTTNRFVFVGGEVRHPGRFNWTEGLTLTNAVQAAGGFTDFANRSGLELRRADGSFER